MLVWGCFEQREKLKTRKPSGGHLKILPTWLSIQQGHSRKVFFHPFCQELEKYIHPCMRVEQAVQFPATAPRHSVMFWLPPPQLEHLNSVYKHKHGRVGHKRATLKAIKVLFSSFYTAYINIPQLGTIVNKSPWLEVYAFLCSPFIRF